jgi:hypothetical protein
VASPTADIVHPKLTWCGKRYVFTSKHHGGDRAASRWTLTCDEEFLVFDCADFQDIGDAKGNLFGVLLDEEGDLRSMGYWNEQIAQFPLASDGGPWHGYPCWALDEEAPSNRRSHNRRPAKEVFDKLLGKKLITEQQRKRLLKGDHA